MVVQPTATDLRFRFNESRFAKFLLERGDVVVGIESHHEGGFCAAVASRFRDAVEGGAIDGLPGVEPIIYAVRPDSLILAVRDASLPLGSEWPLAQVASHAFEVDEVACFGDETYTECCAAIRELVRRANRLLPPLAMLAAATA